MIKRTGSGRQAAAELRDVPKGVVPYATAVALTRTAKASQPVLVAEMQQVFDRPTRYTLNSTFVQPATKDRLAARVMIKDQAAQGHAPEHYMVPGVFGGGRREKGFELAMRYLGVLAAGERVVPGAAAELDASGNMKRTQIRSILSDLGHQFKGGKPAKRARKGAAARDAYFAAAVGARGARGVWLRHGGTRRVEPVLIFTKRPPTYRPRLNFETVVDRTTRERFQAEFRRAAGDIMNRKRK